MNKKILLLIDDGLINEAQALNKKMDSIALAKSNDYYHKSALLNESIAKLYKNELSGDAFNELYLNKNNIKDSTHLFMFYEAGSHYYEKDPEKTNYMMEKALAYSQDSKDFDVQFRRKLVKLRQLYNLQYRNSSRESLKKTGILDSIYHVLGHIYQDYDRLNNNQKVWYNIMKIAFLENQVIDSMIYFVDNIDELTEGTRNYNAKVLNSVYRSYYLDNEGLQEEKMNALLEGNKYVDSIQNDNTIFKSFDAIFVQNLYINKNYKEALRWGWKAKKHGTENLHLSYNYYKNMAETHMKLGNVDSSRLYLLSHYRIHNEFMNSYKDLLINYNSKKIAEEKEEIRLKLEIEKRKMVRNLILIGSLLGLLLIVYYLTKKRQKVLLTANEKINEQNISLNRAINFVSKEIGAPISKIDELVEKLKEIPEDQEEKRKKVLNEIGELGGLGLRKSLNILSLLKVDSAASNIDVKQPVELNSIVNKTLEDNYSNILEKDTEVIFEDHGPANLLANQEMLNEAVNDLLLFCYQSFNETPKTIKIETNQIQNKTVLEITMIGDAKDIGKKIDLLRNDDANSVKNEEDDLLLYLIKKIIVDLFHGKINIEFKENAFVYARVELPNTTI